MKFFMLLFGLDAYTHRWKAHSQYTLLTSFSYVY